MAYSHSLIDEDGCPPVLAVELLAVHVLEAALLLVVVVEVTVGADVLVGVVVGDVVIGVALLFTSSLAASAPSKVVWGLPSSKLFAGGTTTVPLAALSSSIAGVDTVRVPRMVSISS